MGEEKKPVITCLILHNQLGEVDLEAFVQDLSLNGFEPTYVRAVVRKGAATHVKYVDFASAEAALAFRGFLHAGGLLMGNKIAKTNAKLSNKTSNTVSLKD